MTHEEHPAINIVRIAIQAMIITKFELWTSDKMKNEYGTNDEKKYTFVLSELSHSSYFRSY